MMKLIRTSRLSIKNSLSPEPAACLDLSPDLLFLGLGLSVAVQGSFVTRFTVSCVGFRVGEGSEFRVECWNLVEG